MNPQPCDATNIEHSNAVTLLRAKEMRTHRGRVNPKTRVHNSTANPGHPEWTKCRGVDNCTQCRRVDNWTKCRCAADCTCRL